MYDLKVPPVNDDSFYIYNDFVNTPYKILLMSITGNDYQVARS